MRSPKRAWPWLLSGALSSGAHAALAQEPTAAPAPGNTSSLSWTRLTGAESCTGTIEIAKKVEALLQRPAIVSAASAELSIEGRVERTIDGRFRATIVLAKNTGEIVGSRELETHGEACSELDEPASLAIALLIDPDALSRPRVEAPPKPPVVPDPLPPPEPAPVAPPPPDTPLRFEGYLGGYAAIGLVPFAGGLIAGVAIDPPFWGAFEGNATLTLNSQSIEGTEALADFWHFQVSGYYCPLAGHIGLFQGSLCGGGQAGFIATSTTGFVDDEEHVRPVVNGALRGRIGVWPAPFSFTAGATLGVPIIRDAYLYTDAAGAARTLWEAQPVEGGFDLSIGFKFPADKPPPPPPPPPTLPEELPPEQRRAP
jgi:hypothetical protein